MGGEGRGEGGANGQEEEEDMVLENMESEEHLPCCCLENVVVIGGEFLTLLKCACRGINERLEEMSEACGKKRRMERQSEEVASDSTNDNERVENEKVRKSDSGEISKAKQYDKRDEKS